MRKLVFIFISILRLTHVSNYFFPLFFQPYGMLGMFIFYNKTIIISANTYTTLIWKTFNVLLMEYMEVYFFVLYIDTFDSL